MKLALVVLALGASGCDLLFDLHEIDVAVGDAGVADADADVTGDSDAANCGMHDEDGDSVFDKCDRCPTINDHDDGDADADGVGNLCDPDPGLPNTIDAFYSFQNGVGLNDTAVSYPNDTAKITDGGNIVTVRQFAAPEVINVSIANLNPGGPSLEIVVNPGATGVLTCQLGTVCTNSAPTCLFLFDAGGQLDEVNMTTLASEAKSLVMYRDGGGVVHCSLNDLAAIHTVTAFAAVMPSGKIELQSVAGATTLNNMIVYNVE